MKAITTALATVAIFAAGWLGGQATGGVSAKDPSPCHGCPSIEKTIEQFGMGEADLGFNAWYDLNRDGAITIADIVLAVLCKQKGR